MSSLKVVTVSGYEVPKALSEADVVVAGAGLGGFAATLRAAPEGGAAAQNGF